MFRFGLFCVMLFVLVGCTPAAEITAVEEKTEATAESVIEEVRETTVADALSAATEVSEAGETIAAEVSDAVDGKALLADRCGSCHGLDRTERARKTEAEWRVTVTRMVQKGAALNTDETELLIRFLAQTYPK